MTTATRPGSLVIELSYLHHRVELVELLIKQDKTLSFGLNNSIFFGFSVRIGGKGVFVSFELCHISVVLYVLRVFVS